NELVINDKIKSIKDAIHTEFDKIELHDIENTTFYISDNINNVSELDFLMSINQFVDELKHHNLFSSQPIGVVTKKNEILNKQYIYLYVEIPSIKSDYTNTITLNGQYLVGYHVGLDQTIYETYQKMFNKIEELNLEIGQYVFEEYVFDSVIKNNEKEYITKI